MLLQKPKPCKSKSVLLAHYLDVPVIAEGVETKNQLDLLREAGCNLVQGYYFSRPLPADEFEQKVFGGKALPKS